MSAVWIDTDVAVAVSASWVRFGDDLHRRAFELEHRLVDLALGDQIGAVSDLTAAATELWIAATVLRRCAEAVVHADASFDPTDDGDVARVRAAVESGVSSATTGRAFSSALGDPGGTDGRELRTPYVTHGSSPVERGRHLAARALGDTADARRIRPDEFGLVRLDGGRYVVVLPGVVDLSSLALGWDTGHRSVRDLDRGAVGSSRSTGSAGNPYARMVWESLVTAGVPKGAEVMLVGHSYGADTALDLAAEAGFNGPDGFRITHVVAAGYHSTPQLAHVPERTEALVLQNHQDVSVIVEAIGESGLTEAAASSMATFRALGELDPLAAGRHHARTLRHQVGALWSAATHVIHRSDDLAEIAVGAAGGDPRRVVDGVTGFVTLEPGVRTPTPRQVVSVFDGGFAGLGHDPSHYLEHVREVDDPAVTAFLESVDAAGYTAPGVALAIDVSVPEAT